MKLGNIGNYRRDSNNMKVLLLIVIVTVITTNGYLMYNWKNQSNKFVVVDSDNNALLATHRKLTDLEIVAKMEDHVRDFYKLFFEYGYELEGPNSWGYRLDKALKLIDESGIDVHNNLASKGIYEKVVKERWSVRAEVIKFEWDLSNGIKGKVYGTQKLMFGNNKSKTRKLNAVFEMNLIVGIESDNPHGYQILNFKIIDNGEL